MTISREMPSEMLRANDDLRAEVLAWARANNIDPNRVPSDAEMLVNGDVINYSSIVIDETKKGTEMPDGSYMPAAKLDPNARNSVLTERKSTPLLVQPSAAVRQYLASTVRV